MKKFFTCLLAMILAVATALPYAVSAFGRPSFPPSLDEIFLQIENGEATIRYTPHVGFYAVHEIDQGLEFTILGDFALERGGFMQNTEQHLAITSEGGFGNPTTPISGVHSGRTIHGLFWGGVFAVGGTAVSHVGASTLAETNNSQSRASVTPGRTATPVPSLWQNNGTVASISAPNSIFGGNQSHWRLEGR